MTYVITYENVGQGSAFGVYVTDQLDPNLDETSLRIPSNTTYISSTRTLLWDVGELAPKGGGPDPQRMEKDGPAYLESRFPRLDTIKIATVIPAL